MNIDNSFGELSEETLFEGVFDQPIVALQVNDRYLYDHYHIVERLGNYIRMAYHNDQLKNVTIYTWDAGRNHIRNASRDEQNRAIAQLQSKFPKTLIDFKRTNNVEHDRFMILERSNGTFARILFGKGLDFIRKDGTVERTYIVIEDPYQP